MLMLISVVCPNSTGKAKIIKIEVNVVPFPFILKAEVVLLSISSSHFLHDDGLTH